ncbi:MAG: DUF1028 domain-containing protein [Candidatus Acidoferrales bacterium]
MKKRWLAAFLSILLGAVALVGATPTPGVVATFSIAAYDPQTGDLGVAVASKFPAVGAMVPWARAGVGAVATQAAANLEFGPKGLEMMQLGFSAQEALDQLIENDSRRHDRQVGLVDAEGRAAAWTGSNCFAFAGHIVGQNYTVQGNILSGREVIEAMSEAFTRAPGPLAERLLAALEAGDATGGDRRGKQSAALLVVREGAGYGGANDRWIDLRVDDHSEPVAELRRLFDLHTFYFGESTDLVPLTPALVREIQRLLTRAGFYQGETLGVYDAETRRALEDFQGWENLEMRFRTDDKIDAVVLDYLRQQYGEDK